MPSSIIVRIWIVISCVSCSVALADPAEFWTRGDAGCPAGAKLHPKDAGGNTEAYCELAGDKHGPYAKWTNGKLDEAGAYDHGKKDGAWTSFWKNGKKQSTQIYRRDKRDGAWTTWYSAGGKMMEGTYADDKPDGTFRQWDGTGKLVGTFVMKRGTGTFVIWYESGQKQSEDPLVDGKRDGTYTTWHENGQKERESHFRNDLAEGREVEWDERGHKLDEGTYHDGKLDGPATFYDPATGRIDHVEIYERGRRVATVDYQDDKPLADKDPDQGTCKTDDGVRAAFARATGGALGEHDCIARPEHFGAVVLVGRFAYDRGCRTAGMFFDCTWQGTSRQALARAGWKRAHGAAKTRLALEYVRDVELAWGGSVDTARGEPVATEDKSGGVSVLIWVKPSPGMRRVTIVNQLEYTIGADGAVASKVAKTVEE